MTKQEELVDRLERLLDVALSEILAGDPDNTLLALQEALSTAERLPKKADAQQLVICLPDESR